MKISIIRIIYYIIPSLAVIWMSGCSNRFDSDDRKQDSKSVDRMSVSRFYSISKFFKEKSATNQNNIKFSFLNKHYFLSSSRYVYSNINKGSYISYDYEVQPGDTLYYIAWITDNDYCSLAKMNNMGVNDVLKVGQVLQVSQKDKFLDNTFLRKNLGSNSLVKKTVKKGTVPGVNISSANHLCENNIRNNSDINGCRILNRDSMELFSSSNYRTQKLAISKSNVSVLSNKGNIFSEVLSPGNNILKRQSMVSWCWPTIGKVISVFSSVEGGNKGIDISGSVGQSVFSASAGKVVYTGNILFGYGNLIVIKHDNYFLSTYAHNDEILVSEQQNVVLGQKIATMGNSGCNIVKLHFEIRHKGRSVDPLYYLPKR